MKIVSICEKICDTTIITFKSNYIFNLEELQNAITASINKTFEQIMQYYQQIIKYLIIVYEGFENHMGQVNKTLFNLKNFILFLYLDGRTMGYIY